MNTNTQSLESCFDSLSGSITPNKNSSNKRQSNALAPTSDRKRVTPSSSRNGNRGDRFIPTRSGMDLDVSHFELTRGSTADSENNTHANASPAKEEYNSKLAQTLMQSNPSSKVLAFKNKPGLEHFLQGMFLGELPVRHGLARTGADDKRAPARFGLDQADGFKGQQGFAQ